MPFAGPTAIIRRRFRPFDSDSVLLIRFSREELAQPECIISIIGCGVDCRVGAVRAVGNHVEVDSRCARAGLHRKLSDSRPMLPVDSFKSAQVPLRLVQMLMLLL